MGTRRLDLKAAAAQLGITSEAVRRRAKRGTLPSEMGEDGRLYVWVHDVSDDGSHDGDPQERRDRDRDLLLESMQDQIDTLKREVEDWKEEARRKDTIIMTMAQRIPELEPAREVSPEPRESPETVTEESARDDVPPEQEKRVSWWRKLFS
jgi:hypothetical protein